MLIYVTLGHLVYDFGTVKNRGTEKIEPNRTGTEKGTETGTVQPLNSIHSLLYSRNDKKTHGLCLFALDFGYMLPPNQS